MRLETLPEKMRPAVFIEGNHWREDLLWMFHQGSRFQALLEIGSFRGKTAYSWLSSGIPTVVSIDSCDVHWAPHVAEEMLRVNLSSFKDRWLLVKDADEEAALLHSVAPNGFDIVFVNCTASDSRLIEKIGVACRFVKPDGFICGNGYDPLRIGDPDQHGIMSTIDSVFPGRCLEAKSIWIAQFAAARKRMFNA